MRNVFAHTWRSIKSQEEHIDITSLSSEHWWNCTGNPKGNDGTVWTLRLSILSRNGLVSQSTQEFAIHTLRFNLLDSPTLPHAVQRPCNDDDSTIIPSSLLEIHSPRTEAWLVGRPIAFDLVDQFVCRVLDWRFLGGFFQNSCWFSSLSRLRSSRAAWQTKPANYAWQADHRTTTLHQKHSTAHGSYVKLHSTPWTMWEPNISFVRAWSTKVHSAEKFHHASFNTDT